MAEHKTLILLRHAKSSWSDSTLNDIQRPLNKRGNRDAPKMGKHLAKKKLVPQVIFSSPGLRALTTARLISVELGMKPTEIIIENDLYTFNRDQLLEVLKSINDKYEDVMVVGHNPAITDSVNYLCGSDIDNVPTCGLAVLDLSINSWKHVIKKEPALRVLIILKNCGRKHSSFLILKQLKLKGDMVMEISTPDLCDANPDSVQILEPVFRNYGGKTAFGGEVVTIKCFEDNSRVKENAGVNGEGKVMVVDGGGSLKKALLGDLIAESALNNGWEGFIIYGCIRDVEAIGKMEIGVKALNSIPLKTQRKGEGELNIPITVADVTINPGDFIYCDETGVIVSKQPLIK